jgi:hypothetical protein
MGDSEGDAAGKLFIGGVSWQTTEVWKSEAYWCKSLQARVPPPAKILSKHFFRT